LASETVHLARTIVPEYQLEGGNANVEIWSDLPGGSMALRYSIGLPTGAGRQAQRLVLPGTLKGKLWKFRAYPTGAAKLRLFGLRVWARAIGAAASAWGWVPVPMPATGDWVEVKLEIPPTPDEWAAVKLDISPTADEWSEVRLPIPETAEDWAAVKLPIEPSDEELVVAELPVEG
jgi:hypothetical protein